ncbi:hypothetical protein NFX46_12110 [Streptomyces phaeoluteigriseus]|uniref:Integral membrane protein n=1 Tax=Streptomyces phaeoluteigriseus TaxID=114686 RepID=A0ABY4Z6J0_9ACTN|nr:hypothetical protein [Streptomyces phaeoluteigriseus]USQ84467.1 hypothetical protein NFX46_12110 [Streptomyces phaeoluteigriseus]
MSALALSVLLCLVSALCYAVAALLQERAAVAAPRSAVRTAPRSGLWWAALTLNGGGGLLHVLALRWGPLNLVQPLGALTIVFALPLSSLGRSRGAGRAGAGRTAWAGAGLVAGSLALLTVLVDTGPAVPLAVRDQSLIAAGGIGVAALLAGAAAGVRRPAGRAAVLATAAGVAFGVASVQVKVVVDGWAVSAVSAQAVGLCLTAVMAGTGLAASQASYRDAGLAVPLVTMTLVNPVVASVIGVAVMNDGFRHGAAGVPLALAAATTAAVGLLALAGHRTDPAGAAPRAGAPDRMTAAKTRRRAASRLSRASPGRRVSCPSLHGRESPDVTRGQSCRKNPCISQ